MLQKFYEKNPKKLASHRKITRVGGGVDTSLGRTALALSTLTKVATARLLAFAVFLYSPLLRSY